MLAEGAVGTMGVVMLDVVSEHGLQMAATEDERTVEAFTPQGADHAQMALARGAWIGVFTTLTPSAVNTVSKEVVNLVSRSRMRNLTSLASSASVIERLRACWVTQPVTGLAVTPAIRTRRVSWWMKTRT